MSRSSLAIALMLVLGAFVWLARVVAANLGSLPLFAVSLTKEFGGFNGSSGAGSLTIPPSASLSNANLPVQQGVLSTFVLVAVMLGYLVWRVKRVVPRDQDNGSSFIVFTLIALGAFLTFLVGGRALVGILVDLAQPRAAGGEMLLAASTAIYALGAGVAGVTIASLVLFALRRRRRGLGEAGSAADEIAQGFSDVIEGTVYSLRAGSDFRLAVLRCYKSLCDLLQDGGASDSPELTAREFEAMAEERLSIRSDHLRRITELFEKARYSRDTVDEADARDAEASLLSLEREVRSRTSGAPGGARL